MPAGSIESLPSERQSACVIAPPDFATHGVCSWGMMYFEDLNVGDIWASTECHVDHEEMLTYGRTNDPWPIHLNPEAAANSPFSGLIASGGYAITLMYRLSHEIVNQPDRTWAFLGGLTGMSSFSNPSVQVTSCTNASQFWRSAVEQAWTGHRQAPDRTDQQPKACGAIY